MMSFKNIPFKKIITILVPILLIVFALFFFKGCNNNNLQSQLTIDALSGQLKKSIDKTGAEISEKQLIMLNYSALKAIHAADSSEIGKLKKLINKNTISVTTVTTVTSGTLSTNKPVTTFPTNTLIANTFNLGCDSIYAQYVGILQDQWSSISIVANKDSINAFYEMYNQFEFTQEYKKEGKWPFRQKIAIVKARNLNPHTVTNGISSYAIPQPNVAKKIAGVGAASLILGVIFGVAISN